MVRSHKLAWLFLCLLFFTGITNAASIKVTLDRDVVSTNDSFTLFFQTTGSVDDDPDFSPLEKDFSILTNQKRSNLSIINGKRSSNTEWLVEVMAKREGVLTIPVIKFGKDQSPTAQVTVKNAPVITGQDSTDDEIFIEIEITSEHSWVQAQIIYTIRLFRSVNTFNSSLSEPEISNGQMITVKLEDRQFETSKNNKRYVVLQRRYALFPQASGQFTINPIIFKGQVSQRSRHLFDPFGRNSLTVQRLSRAINLNIKAIPVSYTGKTWLPAKKLELNEKWMKDTLELVAGEPVTRTIVIKAEGLTSEQLPEIGVSELDDFKIYPDQPEMHNQTSRNGVLAIRQEKSAVIPHKAGEFVLPAVEMNWWNTQTGKMEIARLPERVINVLPGAATEQQTEQYEINSKSGNESSVDMAVKEPLPQEQGNGYWPWIALVLALGWITTAITWWRQNQRQETPEVISQPNLSQRSTLRSLREAVRRNEPEPIKEALLNWAKSTWPDQAPANLTDLGYLCGEPAQQEIVLLNQSIYGKTKQPWNGERLLLAIENVDGFKMKQNKEEKNELEPLYKITG